MQKIGAGSQYRFYGESIRAGSGTMEVQYTNKYSITDTGQCDRLQYCMMQSI